MDASFGAPLPNPNTLFALLGGTVCSVIASASGSLSSVVVSAAVGAAVSYLTGLVLKRLFEKRKR